MPQNTWLNGTPYWGGEQLDETAMAIILAWRLTLDPRSGLVGSEDFYVSLVRDAAWFLMGRQNTHTQERWEEQWGLSPNSIAAFVSALIIAAAWAEERNETDDASRYRQKAHGTRWTTPTTNRGLCGPRMRQRPAALAIADPSQDNSPDRRAAIGADWGAQATRVGRGYVGRAYRRAEWTAQGTRTEPVAHCSRLHVVHVACRPRCSCIRLLSACASTSHVRTRTAVSRSRRKLRCRCCVGGEGIEVNAEFDDGAPVSLAGIAVSPALNVGYCSLVAVTSVFQVVVPDSIWVAERPVWFGGVRLRSKTTVVRLSGGALWVHSPCTPTNDVCAALDALGEVRWIVVPNRFHHLETPATAVRYPNALVVGPKSAEVRNPRVSVAMGADGPAYVEATPELASIELKGVPFLDETVFYHRASGSLIAADLLLSACARDHFTWRIAARLFGRYERVRTPPDVQMHTRASAAVTESIAQMCALPLQRILVAHADPITERPVEQLADAWKFAAPAEPRQNDAPS